MTLDPATFERVLQSQRGFGRVFCEWRARTREGEPHQGELDELVAAALGEVHDDQSVLGGYRQVSARYARQLAAFWLEHNLGDRTPPAEADDADSPVTKPFFDLFSTEPVYFTSTSTKTLHDRDAGIVVVDRSEIGLLWFADDE